MQSRRTIQSSISSSNYDDYFRYEPSKEAKYNPKPFDVNKPRIFSFEDMKRYSKIDQPSMSKQKKKRIEDKLELQRNAQVITVSRLNKDNLLVKYSQNPFMNLHDNKNIEAFPFQIKERYQHDHANRAKIIECAERLENYKNHQNIVKAVNELNDRDIFRKKKERTHCDDLTDISRKINQQAQIVRRQLQIPQKQQSFKAEVKKQLSFDQIIQMQDENYYTKNQIEINLFQFMKGKHKPFLTRDILDQFYFSHFSMVDRVIAFKVPFLREISKIGRNFILDKKFIEPGRMSHISSKQITFKVSKLNCQDLLSIGSGRFTPDIIYKIMNEADFKEQLSVKSEVSYDQIHYKDNELNKKMYYNNKKLQKFEIEDYLKIEDDYQEERYNRKCRHVYNNVQEQVIKKSHLTSNTIRDRQLHQEISHTINNHLHFLVDMDRIQEEPQKMIRYNKVNKNRNEKNKIRALLDSIIIKNREEAKLKVLLGGNK